MKKKIARYCSFAKCSIFVVDIIGVDVDTTEKPSPMGLGAMHRLKSVVLHLECVNENFQNDPKTGKKEDK